MAAVRPQILVIDDEPQIHRFLSPALDAAGYEPRRADSGQEGLRGIALWSPDAVVLDLGLPDMDGKDVLARAREFYAGPIIILSAKRSVEDRVRGLETGSDDYLSKPVSREQLQICLQRWLPGRASFTVRHPDAAVDSVVTPLATPRPAAAIAPAPASSAAAFPANC